MTDLIKVPFYADGLGSVPSGWKRVKGPGSDPGFTGTAAVGTDEHGDETGAVVHSLQSEWTESFEAIIGGSPTIPEALGVLDNGCTLLSIDISTDENAAKMELKYKRFTVSDRAPARKYVHGITFPEGYTGQGAVDWGGGTKSATDINEPLSGKITIACSETAAFPSGTYKGHEVHSGTMKGSTSWLNKPTTNVGTGKRCVSAKPDRSAKDFFKWDVDWEAPNVSEEVSA